MRIGVFDSGVGGLSVANAIKKEFPRLEVVLREDRENLPYGTKTPAQLLELVMPILTEMAEDGCSTIVVACNTVSTNIISDLRAGLPQVHLIAVEPMLKPAVELSRTGVVGVCATPATLHSSRYAEMKRLHTKGRTIVEPDCHDWASMIEHNRIESGKIRTTVLGMLDAGADVIVLGCTHYHWIEQEIRSMVEGKATVLQPEQAVIRQLGRLIAD